MCPSEHVISKCDMVTSVLQVGDDVPSEQDNKLIMQHTLALQPAGDMLLMRRAGQWH